MTVQGRLLEILAIKPTTLKYLEKFMNTQLATSAYKKNPKGSH